MRNSTLNTRCFPGKRYAPRFTGARASKLIQKNGEDIIYDATNITSNGRKEVLKLIKEFDCKKVCIFFDTPKAIRTERAKYRARVVPEYAIARMEKLLEVPTVNEGWDEVIHLLSGREIRYSDFTVSQNEPFVWIEDDNIEGACWNVMLDAQCNVDEVFGTNVETPDNDAYLNVYANLTPSLEFITPELSVIYNEEGSPHDFEEWKRPLNEKEQKNILALIQRYAGQWLLEQAAKNKEDINA